MEPDAAEAAVPENLQRTLRDRSKLKTPQRFGDPVAYFVESSPTTFHDAMSRDDADQWKAAMDEEIKALEENNTWTLCELPAGKRAIGCRWVYAIKHDAAGNFQRYKARLVAKGYSQREGLDFFETFSPVVRYESIRLLLSIAAKYDLELAKFDVKTAFLYGELEEELYLQQPPGYANEDRPGAVLRLNRSLYGLKQSPRCWNEKFVNLLKKFNFKNINSDKCVFMGVVQKCVVYLALYVDDGLIVSESMNAISEVLENLKSQFKITFGAADDFVGMEIQRNRERRTIKISQSGYIAKIIDRFGLKDAKSVSVPAERNLYSTRTSPGPEPIDVPYREAVGSLLFAARVTRPDIEFAVNYASQFCNNPSESDWHVVQTIFRYLQGTRDLGIVYADRGSGLDLVGYTDADLAGCPITRRSHSGVVLILNGGPVVWSSRRQSEVTECTMNAEYVALFDGAREAVWLKRFLIELDIKCTTIPMYIDNKPAISVVKNCEDNKKSKYIDIKYHYTREVVNKRDIFVEYIASNDNLADIFTKPLAKPRFCQLREGLNEHA